MKSQEIKEIDKIESNYNVYLKLCDSLGNRAEKFKEMVEFFGERLAIAPFSSEYGGSYEGGLVDFSLSVLKRMRDVVKVTKTKVDKRSMIICCLFFAIGIVGTRKDDLFEKSDAYWTERGKPYTYNKDISFMATTHRSLFLIQEFGIKLTEEEWLAILLSYGPGYPENHRYRMKEPDLAVLLSNCIDIVRIQGKTKKNILS